MNKYIKQFFLFAIVFVFLMSVSYAVDDSQTQVNIEEQSAQEEYVDEAIDSTRDILDLENTVTTIEDSSKTLKSEEESVPVEYVNITQRNYKNLYKKKIPHSLLIFLDCFCLSRRCWSMP